MATPHIEQAAISLITIYEQLDALKWLITDKNELSQLISIFHQNVANNPFYLLEQPLVKTVQEIITKKKFWYDSWLS